MSESNYKEFRFKTALLLGALSHLDYMSSKDAIENFEEQIHKFIQNNMSYEELHDARMEYYSKKPKDDDET